MASRRRVIPLFLIVTLIDPSGQNCADYFNMANWSGQDLTCTFPLAQSGDPRDVITCTLRDVCQRTNRTLFCAIHRSCFTGQAEDSCQGSSSQNISFYHLLCLAAKAKDDSIVPEGCRYESVCGLYRQVSLDRNTTADPSSVLPTAAAPAAVCTLPPTPGTTIGTWTEGREGDGSKRTETQDACRWSPLLIPSIIGNVVLALVLLALVLYLRRTGGDRRQDTPVQTDRLLLDSSVNDATTTDDTAGDRSTPH